MGEAYLVAFLQVLVDKMARREVFKYFGLIKGVDQKLQKWTATLSAIGAVLNEAEERQLITESKPLKLWLDDLRDLAYDVEDVLDKYATKMLKREIEQGHYAGTARRVWNSVPHGVFNYKMNSEIQKITERLQEISHRKDQLSFNIITGTTSSTKARQNLPPSSSQPDGPVIGREDDKRQVGEFLSKQERGAVNFDVVAIVGMAGVGKTTLAAQVFNEIDATQQFKPTAWVCVSDDFNLERVTKQILGAVTSRQCPTEDFNQVQQDLNKELAGKKFLIVLDDVWGTCSYGLWMKLQSPFRDGAPGSKIIVTTRDAEVSKMMGARTLVHNLEPMSNDVCFEVFEQHAFRNVNRDIPPNFESLKEKIVARCRGLPLAARTLGGLLLRKEMNEWEEILNNKLWSLSNERDILPVLRLSYHYLPSHLKRCFAYCSILPNDYEFREHQLILLWMAEGLIQPQPEHNKQMEDLGTDYFQELLSRSLFQKSSKNNSKYVMHDLVVGLAQWAAGDICFRLEDKQNSDHVQLGCFTKARHASYISGKYDVVKRFEAFSEVKHLRTFLPLSVDPSWSYLSRKVTFDLLPKLQYLRVLSLNGYKVTELPNSIGNLKYLRYLDLSHTRIKSLPESTTTLFNLQTLILEGCRYLEALPIDLRNLLNLRHLNNSGVYSLKAMPPQLGRLTNLQSLPNFVVGKGSEESGIREIGSLSHLRGTLSLSRLENVIDAEDARKADLKSKERVDKLVLEWSDNTQETQLGVLDRLEPHRMLKKLIIRGYAGLEFSTWIGDRLFSTMVHVRLDKCKNCQILPPLGQLPLLKELYITRMAAVENVGPEFYGEGSLPFPVLETLEFEDMQHWKKWVPFVGDQGIGVFSCLKWLSIRNCPQLEGKVPENLDSLATLQIIKCQELVISISNYKQIGALDMKDCKAVVVKTSGVEFELLNSLRLSNISELRFQTGEFTKGLRKVAKLTIGGCEELTSSLKNEDRVLQHLISLDRLVIEGNSSLLEKLGKEAEELLQLQILTCKLKYLELNKCASLSKVPEGLHHLTALQRLDIVGCSSLVSFPDVGLPPSLEVIRIEECDSLLYFAKYQIPPNLRIIEIRRCKTLKSLVEKEEDSSSSSSSSPISLEHLEIQRCDSLTSLSLRAQLFPRALKGLHIWGCKELQLITSDVLAHDNTNYCLEYIKIWSCPNLKSLPEGLCHLTNLQTLEIYRCGSLVSIPSLSGEGLPSPTTTTASSLRQIHILNCNKLEMLPDMRNLNCLQELYIDYGEGLKFTSFPPNLTSLKISGIKNCKPMWELLPTLTSLTELSISGEDPSVVSFPPDSYREMEMEMLLPNSLTNLSISDFPNMKKLSSKGFQSLTSLQSLGLGNCPKLAYIPEQGLPISLRRLHIIRCPLLKDKCQPGSKGRYLPKISHIPYMFITD
ncbi:PREDICTED: putative disease resistance RPP13-like protein 1 [Prunus mume]|uniref:Disease resistance RPP13-like protein 1 n=1 Tax=Prunus mume TaxID=102107 RepID=A0ABM0NY06_PRUMU|nr:PREDICTED: putative disease resistance RPP13-like protein 1 [Prunus mume]XP_008231491.2 PREDICTED: putative disease resistance RPP13-like protein 1 [Prunus mume]XP_016650111.1 PREDICTED: putative disease resistance RPP13-like protein 1 [Prunus mume]XP_016650112.1 PREDICTED: putative disease resistance RPP13-like protein 1 [Prunus mume]